MKTTKGLQAVCPACRSSLDAATSIDRDDVPGPGDTTVCLHCAEVLVFTKGMGLRQASSMELACLDDEVLRLLNVVRMAAMSIRSN